MKDDRKLCVVCAWSSTCKRKYSMPDGVGAHCIDFVRDVKLEREEPKKETDKRGNK
ncbi:MAG: hypothetical protein ACE5EA_09660 [Nitrospirota bacterium]